MAVLGISLEINSGTAPFTYSWSDGFNEEDRVDLIPGNYSISITDAQGCFFIENFIIDNYPNIFIFEQIEDLSCATLNQGSISILMSGLHPPYTFEWNTGSSEFMLENLLAGEYTLNLIDSNQCIYTRLFEVDSPDTLISENIITQPDYNMSNGSIELIISGGTPPYLVNWIVPNSGQGTLVENLPVGDYWFQVFDSLNCVLSQNITLDFIDALTEIDKSSEIKISPNPTDGWIEILYENHKPNSIQLFNELSQEMKITTNETLNRIDLSQYPDGIYYIVIHFDEGSAIKPVIKIK